MSDWDAFRQRAIMNTVVARRSLSWRGRLVFPAPHRFGTGSWPPWKFETVSDARFELLAARWFNETGRDRVTVGYWRRHRDVDCSAAQSRNVSCLGMVGGFRESRARRRLSG